MATLDKTQPYAEITGDDYGAKFEQNNLMFDCNGDEMVTLAPIGKPSLDGDLPHEEASPTMGKPTFDEIHHANDVEPEPEAPAINKLPIVQLKQIMDAHDEPYVNKAQAVAFLEGKRDE